MSNFSSIMFLWFSWVFVVVLCHPDDLGSLLPSVGECSVSVIILYPFVILWLHCISLWSPHTPCCWLTFVCDCFSSLSVCFAPLWGGFMSLNLLLRISLLGPVTPWLPVVTDGGKSLFKGLTSTFAKTIQSWSVNWAFVSLKTCDFWCDKSFHGNLTIIQLWNLKQVSRDVFTMCYIFTPLSSSCSVFNILEIHLIHLRFCRSEWGAQWEEEVFVQLEGWLWHVMRCVSEDEQKKLKKYWGLRDETEKMWKVKVTVVPGVRSTWGYNPHTGIVAPANSHKNINNLCAEEHSWVLTAEILSRALKLPGFLLKTWSWRGQLPTRDG